MPAMLRRSALLSTFALAALAVPATASATTYTVDPAALPGCNVDHVCKTIPDANSTIADGDTVVIKDGTYTLTGPLNVSRTGVTFRGNPGKVVITQTDQRTDTPVVYLGGNDTLEGLTIAVQTGGAEGVIATAAGATIRSSTVARVGNNVTNKPVITSTAGGGVVSIQTSIILQAPTTYGPDRPGAIVGNETSSIQISDSVVASGQGMGIPLVLIGGASNLPNTIVRSQIIALDNNVDAVRLRAFDTHTADQALNLDSSIIAPGTNGIGIDAANDAGLLTKAGAIAISGVHTTIAGGAKPLQLASTVQQVALLTGAPAGPVTAIFDRSIVHGSAQSTVETASTVLNGSSVATIQILRSDATDTHNPPSIRNEQGQVSTDAVLFADPAKRNFHLRSGSPAIDKAGTPEPTVSDRDVDQQPRLVGAAADMGADEFVNLPPTASFTGPTTVRQGQVATFDASKSSDPEAGGGIAKYKWNFGDGQTAETTTPTTTHTYATIGTYNPNLTVVDVAGNPSSPFNGAAVKVTDGTAPEVKITTPKAGATLRIFKTVTKKVKVKVKGRTVTRTKKVKTRQRFDFRGTATDASGIASVEIALRRVSLGARSAATTCVFLSGTGFVSRSCAKSFFPVKVDSQGFWAYRTKSALKLRPGRYELSARATDKNGVVSAPVKISLTFK